MLKQGSAIDGYKLYSESVTAGSLLFKSFRLKSEKVHDVDLSGAVPMQQETTLIQATQRMAALASNGYCGDCASWKNCYPGNDEPRIFKLGFMITTKTMKEKFQNSQTKATEYVEKTVADTSVLFEERMNIRLQIRKIFFGNQNVNHYSQTGCRKISGPVHFYADGGDALRDMACSGLASSIS